MYQSKQWIPNSIQNNNHFRCLEDEQEYFFLPIFTLYTFDLQKMVSEKQNCIWKKTNYFAASLCSLQHLFKLISEFWNLLTNILQKLLQKAKSYKHSSESAPKRKILYCTKKCRIEWHPTYTDSFRCSHGCHCKRGAL